MCIWAGYSHQLRFLVLWGLDEFIIYPHIHTKVTQFAGDQQQPPRCEASPYWPNLQHTNTTADIHAYNHMHLYSLCKAITPKHWRPDMLTCAHIYIVLHLYKRKNIDFISWWFSNVFIVPNIWNRWLIDAHVFWMAYDLTTNQQWSVLTIHYWHIWPVWTYH